MPLEALASAELLPGLLVYDHFQEQQQHQHPDGPYVSALLEALSSGRGNHQQQNQPLPVHSAMPGFPLQQQEDLLPSQRQGRGGQQQQNGGSARKKRRRRARVCKNKEEAETQRRTHIAVERNRRRQMNEHLAALRALMPDTYIQRGDQASIVGGAIDFVKELEQLLQSLEAQKHAILQQQHQHRRMQHHHHRSLRPASTTIMPPPTASSTAIDYDSDGPVAPAAAGGSPFAQFFSYPQYVRWSAGGSTVRDCCQQQHLHQQAAAASDGSSLPPQQQLHPAQHHHQRAAAGGVADIEVTLVETHASMRILSPRRPGQLLRMVAGFHAMQLTVLHLNLTTLDPLVLYTISAKVEEGCGLTTVDDIAAAVHHMLTLIEAECAEAAAAASAVFCS